VSNQDIGKLGEDFAVNLLEKEGYSILYRNLKMSLGEIDIVAERDGILVFVEVKTRRSSKYGLPIEAVDLKKQEKIRIMAEVFMAKFKNRFQKMKGVRFDVISIYISPSGKVDKWEHITNAF